MITRLPKQARSPLVPHLQNGYRTTSIISTASSSFGDAVVDVIDKVIDLAPYHRWHVCAAGGTHTVARAARSLWGFFFGYFAFDERPRRFR
jgi:predicted GTPase